MLYIYNLILIKTLGVKYSYFYFSGKKNEALRGLKTCPTSFSSKVEELKFECRETSPSSRE